MTFENQRSVSENVGRGTTGSIDVGLDPAARMQLFEDYNDCRQVQPGQQPPATCFLPDVSIEEGSGQRTTGAGAAVETSRDDDQQVPNDRVSLPNVGGGAQADCPNGRNDDLGVITYFPGDGTPYLRYTPPARISPPNEGGGNATPPGQGEIQGPIGRPPVNLPPGHGDIKAPIHTPPENVPPGQGEIKGPIGTPPKNFPPGHGGGGGHSESPKQRGPKNGPDCDDDNTWRRRVRPTN